MLQCWAWVGPCSTDAGGLTPGVPVEGTDTVNLLRALTRVLWRELLAAQRVTIVAQWSQTHGVVDVDIRDREGTTLVFHSITADGDHALYTDSWPELTFEDAEPSIEWLIEQVEGWLAVDGEALLEEAGYFPGVADEGTDQEDAWNAVTEDEAMKMAHAAIGRLSDAINQRDRRELQTWVNAVSFQGGRYTMAHVHDWHDEMRWDGLDPSVKERIRSVLRWLLDNDPASGCDGLLLLADLADA